MSEFEGAFQDFQEKLALKKRFTSDDVAKLFKAIDANNNDVIDYSGKKRYSKHKSYALFVEFIAVFAEHHLFKTEKYLKLVFERFDLV